MNIKKFFAKVNWVYAIVFVSFSFYLVNKEGWEALFEFCIVLLALFVPIFAFIQSYKIIRQVIVSESIVRSDIYVLIALIFVASASYFIGLEKAQRVVLIVIDAIVCFFIFLIMLYISSKKKT